MPKNRKRSNRPNASAPAATTASASASASADTNTKENVASVVETPIQSTTVAPKTTPQASVISESNIELMPAALKPAWGPPKTNVSQEATVQKANPSVTPVVPKPAWGPPATNTPQEATVQKVNPSETLAVPKTAGGPPKTNVSQEATVQKANPSVTPVVPKPAWGPPATNTPQEATVQKANPSVTPAVPKTAGGPPVININAPSTLPKPSASTVQTTNSAEQSTTPKFVWGSSTSKTTQSMASTTPKPVNSSASPCRPERAASAFPMTDEIRRNLSANSRDTGNKEGGRARSAASTRGRRIIRSAIPDSAVLFPIPRPDDGGSRGKPITIYTNHFPVRIPNHTINQYDIEISMLTDDGKIFPARKDERWEIMQRISTEIKDFPLVWYDEGKTLYSLELLPDIEKPIKIRMKRNDVVKTFQLEIKELVRQEKLDNIQDFVQKKLRNRPRECVRIIETLLKQTARNDFVAVRNQFYHRNQTLDDLGDGRGMAKGFYQALFLTRSGPTLNVNLTFTCFYMPLNFVDFTCQYLRKDIKKHGLNDQEAKMFKKIIRDLLVETSHTGRPIRYKLRRFGLPADQLTFARGDVDENSAEAATVQRISVEEYFKQTYNIQLEYPYLPCIDGAHGPSKKAHWLPMEIVKVVDWQRAIKPLDSAQRANVSSKSIIRPAERYDRIMEIMKGRDFDADQYLSELGVLVKKNEMMEIKARILDPPAIRYRAAGPGQKESIENVNVGKWRIRNFFYRTPEIRTWGLIYFGDRPTQGQEQMIREFSPKFAKLLRDKGLIIRSELSVTFKPSGKTDIENALKDAHQKKWQLAIIVLNTDAPQVYPFIKQMGNQSLGLRTQCIDISVIQKNMKNLSMLVENISQKINAKLDGINGVVDTQSTLKCSSKDDLFMFIGADVTHSTCSTTRPSIAAVVASRDPTNTLYAARLCEQYPKKGRCSVEIIKDLDRMVADLLVVYAKNCGNRLPTKIVFYRDGVDEGHYQKVLDNEVKKVFDACRTVYRNQSLPKLTFIIVKKRHNTRFFLYENGQTLNINAGTVIDCAITHPSQFDFYLCSQAAIMGTSRPTLYHVLHDDTRFSSDDIQQLTYWLCHTDMRCSKSVSIPAPVHYAHLAAYQARTLDFQDDRNNDEYNDDDDDDEKIDDYSIEDIQTKLMVLNQSVVDSMWYI